MAITSAGLRSCLATLSLSSLCMVASGSAPTYMLILGPQVHLGPVAGLGNFASIAVNATPGDLNGDGKPDIVLGQNGLPPAVFFNNGANSPFQNVAGKLAGPLPDPNVGFNSWGAAAIGDVNGDGHPDILVGGFNAPNYVYLNDGTATPFNSATPISIGTSDTSYLPALGDLNGDGFLDLAVANTNHIPIRVYLTQGAPLTSGHYTTAQVGTDTGYGEAVKIADVNGDGKPDLVLTYIVASTIPTDPSGIRIYLNNGTSDPFNGVTPVQLLPGESVSAIALADFDGDGRPDLAATTEITASSQPALYVLLNTGSASQPYAATQTLQPDLDLGGECYSVSVGDLDGDSRPDLVFGCQRPAFNASPAPTNPALGAIYLNNGTATPFANVAPVDIPAAQNNADGFSVAVAQFDASGRPSVLVADAEHGTVYPTSLDQKPIAQNDAVTGATNAVIPINVLANDSAGPGQNLTVSSVAITTAPQHGTATANASDGSVTYRSASGYSGADAFQYTVSDGLGVVSNAAAVNITVQSAPVAGNDLQTLTANQSVTLDVLGNDTSNGGSINTTSISIAVAPIHGSALVQNGKVLYTPAHGSAGVDAFQYSVQDNLGTTSNVATVSLSVQPPPVASNDTANDQEDQSVTVNVLTNDTSDGGTIDASSISIAAAPAHGTATVKNGAIVYTATTGYSGTDTFAYSVKDNLGAPSNTAQVSVTVAATPGGTGGGGAMDVWEIIVLIVLLIMLRSQDRLHGS